MALGRHPLEYPPKKASKQGRNPEPNPLETASKQHTFYPLTPLPSSNLTKSDKILTKSDTILIKSGQICQNADPKILRRTFWQKKNPVGERTGHQKLGSCHWSGQVLPLAPGTAVLPLVPGAPDWVQCQIAADILFLPLRAFSRLIRLARLGPFPD